MSVKSICVIPARYGSSRFPGKVLADLLGKPVIQHVYEKAAGSKADAVLIAADDERVIAAVNGFGGKAVMTRPAIIPERTAFMKRLLMRITISSSTYRETNRCFRAKLLMN